MDSSLKGHKWQSLSFGLAVVLSLIILFRPGGDGPLPFSQADKVVHAVTFGLLAITARWRFGFTRTLVLQLVVYAVGSEIIQHFWIPGREFDGLDIMADMIGLALILIFRSRRTE